MTLGLTVIPEHIQLLDHPQLETTDPDLVPRTERHEAKSGAETMTIRETVFVMILEPSM